jgi:hypothetical protein
MPEADAEQLLRGPLHDHGPNGLCRECHEPFPCPTGLAIYEAVVRGECSHWRRGPIRQDDSQECLDCGVVFVSSGLARERIRHRRKYRLVANRAEPRIEHRFQLGFSVQFLRVDAMSWITAWATDPSWKLCATTITPTSSWSLMLVPRGDAPGPWKPSNRRWIAS